MYAELKQVWTELTSPGAPFEVTEVEVRGLRLKCYANAPPSLRDIWLASAAHADNDYLEFAAELGLPFTAVLATFVCLAFYNAFQVQRQRHTALYKGAAFAVIMTILWAVIHSTTDFNLQIPANALTFVTVLALAFICRVLPRP